MIDDKSPGLKLEYSYAPYKKIFTRKIISVISLTVPESCANDRMLRWVYLYFYAPYTSYTSISFTVWYTRIGRRRSKPFAYVCIPACMQVRTGNLLPAQFLRNFPLRLPKLTLTVNHSLRKVYASPNRFPIYYAKTVLPAATQLFLSL